MTEFINILLKYKEQLLSENNDITIASIAEKHNYIKSTLYRNAKKIFTKEELKLIKEISRKKAVKKYIITWIDKHNIDNPAKLESSKQKQREIFVKHYGVDNPMKCKEIIQKNKNTCIEHFGVDNYAKTEEFKQLFNNIEFKNKKLEKEYNTKKKNHSFKSSKQEDYIYKLLCNKFGKNNVKRNYYNKLYPWRCDFYIISLDLYIEYQGYVSHGKEPYNPDNPEHIQLVLDFNKKSLELNNEGNNKRLYNNIIETWTKRDPLKRETARKNELNYIEFFNMEQFMEWFNKLD